MNAKTLITASAVTAILAGCMHTAEFKDGAKDPVSVKGMKGTYSFHEQNADETGKESYTDKVIVIAGEGKTADFKTPLYATRGGVQNGDHFQEDIRKNMRYAADEKATAVYKSLVELKAQKTKTDETIKSYELKIKDLEAQGKKDSDENKKLNSELTSEKAKSVDLNKQVAEIEGKYRTLAEEAQKALEALKNKQ